MDFVEICNVCTRKVIIKAAKRIFNSDKICRSYCNFYFGVTFLEHTVDMHEIREEQKRNNAANIYIFIHRQVAQNKKNKIQKIKKKQLNEKQ